MDILLVTAVVLGGLQALRSQRLLTAALWLAVSSALAATILYRAGAPEVAVIELSVGAGLVTILFVFSIAIAGEETMNGRSLVPTTLAWLLIVIAAALLGWAVLPFKAVEPASTELPFASVLWEQRSLDVLVQIGLIFAGVMGILGLLTEPKIEEAADSAVSHTTVQWTEPQAAPPNIMNQGKRLNGFKPDTIPTPEKEAV
ncbi:MAG: NADH-quinone oxidoreductase subunit J [Candidatus Promineifilaceae bacterium]